MTNLRRDRPRGPTPEVKLRYRAARAAKLAAEAADREQCLAEASLTRDRDHNGLSSAERRLAAIGVRIYDLTQYIAASGALGSTVRSNIDVLMAAARDNTLTEGELTEIARELVSNIHRMPAREQDRIASLASPPPGWPRVKQKDVYVPPGLWV